MTDLTEKKIIVAVTGGIAAYKSAELVRLFKKANAEVQVVMTEGAKAFVTPMTFQALSGRPVRSTLLDEAAEAGMGHIELAKWADRIVIAPASADAIARISQGLANDLLTTMVLATDAPLMIAPAMNQAMWHNPVTQHNIGHLSRLMGERVVWIGPDQGDQACGDVGAGRMVEPEDIFAQVSQDLATAKSATKPLAGQRVVITAGPTREPIDPVRYISNHSSGKMGYALAEAAHAAGAQVQLISGPVTLPAPQGVEKISVTTAEEMLEQATTLSRDCDFFIGTAAVADFRPDQQASQKIKKQDGEDNLSLALTKNPDIIATVAKDQPGRPTTVVGFAAETQNANEYGANKLSRKNLDWVVINDVSIPGLGFNSDQNLVTVLHRDKPEQLLQLGPSPKVDIAHQLIKLFYEQKIRQGSQNPATLNANP